jgi:hypothetical protein
MPRHARVGRNRAGFVEPESPIPTEMLTTKSAQAEFSRGYYTAPWRKARICARLLLASDFFDRPRYQRIAAALVRDPEVTNRLIDQAMAQLQARQKRRARAG